MTNVRTKLLNSCQLQRSRKNIKIHGGSSNSRICESCDVRKKLTAYW